MAMTEERFWSKVDRTGDCWLWLAGRAGPSGKGYGLFWADGRTLLAHRYAYERFVGPIPKGMYIDHTCHVTTCVNPAHLRVVTNKQNQENRTGAHRNSKSGVRGVIWDKKFRRWRTHVGHNGKKHQKYFIDFDEACAYVVELRNRLFTHNDADRITSPSPSATASHDRTEEKA